MLKNSRVRLALVITGLACCLGAGAALVSAKNRSKEVKVIRATLKNGAGQKVAIVEFHQSRRSAVKVLVSGRGLPPGFHAMHVHAVGTCDAPDFMTAGGHLKNEGTSHPEHAGDLVSLYVKRDGKVNARFETDRFSLDALRDMDGSAVMIHAGTDNFANIPPRYAPGGPDQMTLDTGDAGARFACGAIR